MLGFMSNNVTTSKSSYKSQNHFERMEAEAARIRDNHPDRVPVIVERAEKSDVLDIEKNKQVI